ncbi:hypothetical protein VTN49DRAFT_7112 [Thermomyces lanuginosus]|uniref:uncharacterized protein n=1 Tax=Thermomyces lanuginosus TaxID=5541 RepID=UPI0037446081
MDFTHSDQMPPSQYEYCSSPSVRLSSTCDLEGVVKESRHRPNFGSNAIDGRDRSGRLGWRINSAGGQDKECEIELKRDKRGVKTSRKKGKISCP